MYLGGGGGEGFLYVGDVPGIVRHFLCLFTQLPFSSCLQALALLMQLTRSRGDKYQSSGKSADIGAYVGPVGVLG